jgi:hypothetical protein
MCCVTEQVFERNIYYARQVILLSLFSSRCIRALRCSDWAYLFLCVAKTKDEEEEEEGSSVSVQGSITEPYCTVIK